MKRNKNEPTYEGLKKLIETQLDYYANFISSHELDHYIIDELNIDGNAVDESQDIEPKEVAALGSYVTLRHMQHYLDGKPMPKDDETSEHIITIDMNDGKRKALPKEVLDILKKLIDNEEEKK